jgi:hypothetical protein
LALESWQLAAVSLILPLWHCNPDSWQLHLKLFLQELESWQLADVSLNLRSSQENPDSFISNSSRGILAAAKALGRENEFYWLASDGWGKQQQVIAG